MINLGFGKIKDLRLGSSKISKVYLGDKLVFRKAVLKALKLKVKTIASPYSNQLHLVSERSYFKNYDVLTSGISGKEMVSLKIGDSKKVTKGFSVSGYDHTIKVLGDFSTTFGITDFIQPDTMVYLEYYD